MADVRQELLDLNQKLLDSITKADWKAYQSLCDASLTCFEPEAQGQLIQGLAFHEYYFKLGAVKGEHCTTMASPHVRILGVTAILSYVRVNQRLQADGTPVTRLVEETRIWQRISGKWKHVHFHRSVPTK
jgi:calcium/calmodulin-dependent protein kinase (CaM kinase) II